MSSRPAVVVAAARTWVRTAFVGGRDRAAARSARPRSTATLGAGRDPAGRRGQPAAPGGARSVPAVLRARPRPHQALAPVAAAGGKCQVFIAPEDDHLRTRLTHAVEVAQVATGIARAANLCLPLTEAIALAHDCGHGPGRARVGGGVLAVRARPGYDHAVYGADVTLAPLNLCVETLDGVRNHSWRRPAAVHARGRGGRVGRPHRVRVPRLRGRGARRHPRARRPARRGRATSSAAGASEQIGAFVLAVLDAIDRTGTSG